MNLLTPCKTAAAAAVLLLAGTAAQATTMLSSQLDWSTPALSFSDQTDYAHVYVGALHDIKSATDWTSAPTAALMDGTSSAAGMTSPTTLSASAMGSLPYTVNVNREGNFTLANNSAVTFSMNYSLARDDSGGVTVPAGLMAVTSVELQLHFVNGGAEAASTRSFSDGLGTYAQNGVITLTYLNTSGADVQLRLAGNANVYFEAAPVPEPGTWALMAAGLAAAGFTARRRRRS